MAYRRKPQNKKMEDQAQKIFTEETQNLPTVEEIEENIKRIIEIDKKLEETLEKLESIPITVPTGRVFIGEEDKRLFKKFNQHVIKKLGISGNRSFKL